MSDAQTPVKGPEKGPETREKPKTLIAVLCVCAAILIVAVLSFTGVLNPAKQEMEIDDNAVPYAEGVVLLEDDGVYDVLEPNAIALEFKNDAYSKDGQTFACYLGNSALNEYDMYVAIYANAELTDELYVSGLVPPGSGFKEVTLDKALDEGDHRVYVAFTQMEDPKTIHAQTIYTMDFHVVPD